MAGQRNNVITYTFEGETLGLEKALQKVVKLSTDAATSLATNQKNGLTAVQKALKDQQDQLISQIRLLKQKKNLTDNERSQMATMMRQALSNAKKLRDMDLRQQDRTARAAESKREHAASKRARKAAKEREARTFAGTLAGQTEAGMQAASLTRLSNVAENLISPAAYKEIQDTINTYNQAVLAFQNGVGTQKELVDATRQLNTVYENYRSTLASVISNQNSANQSIKSAGGFFKYVISKFKSLAVYKTVKAILSRITSAVKESFDDMARVSDRFNKDLGKVIGSFKTLMGNISSVIAPIIELVSPFITTIIMQLDALLGKISEIFNAVADNDSWLKATLQVQDYLDMVNKAAGLTKLDEINTKQSNAIEFKEMGVDDALKPLSALGNILNEVLGLLTNITGPVFSLLADCLGAVATLLGPILNALEPIINFVTWLLGTLSGGLGEALSWIVNSVLVPIVNWLGFIINHLELLIPLIASVLALLAATKWSAFAGSLKAIASGFLSIVKAATAAVASMFKWVAAQIKAIAMNIRNAISAWIAEKAYWKLALAAIAAAGIASIAVAAAIGVAVASGTSTMNANQGNEPRNYMAKGGVVNRPTLAMIGEGKYNEAVIPLGQSEQFQSMKESIAESVVERTTEKSVKSGSTTPVNINIDGKTIARALWPSLASTLSQVGVKIK